MTYDQLLTLDSIIKYGSFKAASEVLHKTQPSLSMAIKKLEEEFNIQLFNREGYRPVLTEQGASFYKKAKNALSQFQELETLAQEIGAGYESEIHLCIDPIIPINKFENIFSMFHEPHISTTLNLSVDLLEGLAQKVMNHEVDIALGSNGAQFINQTENEIEAIKIMEIEMLPVVGKNHEKEVESNENYLTNLPQIFLKSSDSSNNSKLYGSMGNISWFTSDLSMKEQLIESNLGWGSLPLHQINHKLEKTLFPIRNVKCKQPFAIPIYLIRSKKKTMGPNTKKLWEFILESFSESTR